MPADGGIRFGQYVLQRRIARGGMAEVFLAQRGGNGIDRRVAVKRILPLHADTPDFIQMFLGEAKLAASLSHPNIVSIYDYGKVETDYFIAMEYVDGVHAGDVIRRGRAERLPPMMIARIGADAAAALHYVHELRGPGGKPYGLVHRDVSPANLMLSFDGVVKLCDFGIAKAVALGNRPLTQAGLVRGKYAYMSPEQTVGAALDGRSDVYALAIVLWELVVGETLVPRGDAVAAMRAIRHGKLPSIEQAAPDAPPPLADAIRWGLTTAREQRPTAAQFAEALDAYLQSSPELAAPATLGAWLRTRFPRTAGGVLADSPAITQETPSTFSEPFAAGAPASAPTPAIRDAPSAPRSPPASPSSVDPTAETFARPADPAASRPVELATGRPVDLAATRPVDLIATRSFDAAATRELNSAAIRPVDPAATRPVDLIATRHFDAAATREVNPAATSAADPAAARSLDVMANRHADPAAAPTIIVADDGSAPARPRRRQRTGFDLSDLEPEPPAFGHRAGPPDMPPESAHAFTPRSPSGAAPIFAAIGGGSGPQAPTIVSDGAAPRYGPPTSPIPGAGIPALAPTSVPSTAIGTPATTMTLDNADTLMRSGAFRLPVPSGPAAVPTLLDPRAAMRGSPMLGMPVLPAAYGAPHATNPERLRTGRVVAAVAGVALLSFAIAMAARGKPRDATGAAAIASRDAVPTFTATPSAGSPSAASPSTPSPSAASPSAASPSAASPSAAAPSAASPSTTSPSTATRSGVTPAGATPAAAMQAGATQTGTMPGRAAATSNAAGAATAVLDVHTKPAGATVLIRRCREVGGKCSVDRAAAETPIGDCPAAPCTFMLPVGSYEIAVELDGARELRTVELMSDVATSLDILFKPAPSRRAATTGRLTLRAKSCKVALDGRARPAPIIDLDLRPGPHRLELQCGRRPATTRTVTITAGKTTTLDLAPR